MPITQAAHSHTHLGAVNIKQNSSLSCPSEGRVCWFLIQGDALGCPEPLTEPAWGRACGRSARLPLSTRYVYKPSRSLLTVHFMYTFATYWTASLVSSQLPAIVSKAVGKICTWVSVDKWFCFPWCMYRSRVDWRITHGQNCTTISPKGLSDLLPPAKWEGPTPWTILAPLTCFRKPLALVYTRRRWALFTLHALSGHECVLSGEAPHRLCPLWGGLIQLDTKMMTSHALPGSPSIWWLLFFYFINSLTPQFYIKIFKWWPIISVFEQCK